MIPKFWYRWLIVSTTGLMVFGISMVLIPNLAKCMFSILIYFDGTFVDTNFSKVAGDYVSLVHGVLGTAMFAWCFQIFLIIRGPFARLESDAWLLVVIPLGTWFVVDTSFSLLIGYWQNVILNSVLATVFAIPLYSTRQYF